MLHPTPKENVVPFLLANPRLNSELRKNQRFLMLVGECETDLSFEKFENHIYDMAVSGLH